MVSFAANPAIMVSAILKLNLQVEWDILSSYRPSLDKVLMVFYIIYVVASCTVYYTHMLVYIYFNTYFKIQMEALSKYFEDLAANNGHNYESAKLTDVNDQLIIGIQLHARLSRYVMFAEAFGTPPSPIFVFCFFFLFFVVNALLKLIMNY